jgi:hypothetical protein
MKKIFTLLILLIFGYLPLTAQLLTDAPCNDRPTNGENFDWTAQYYTLYTISHGVQSVFSPFNNYSLHDQNTNELSQYAIKDYSASDGWVFIKKDFLLPTYILK